MSQRIVVVEWFDAGYTDKESSVDVFPPAQHTVGVLVEETDEYVHVAVNMYCENGIVEPIDGFFIPKATIAHMRDVGPYVCGLEKTL
ncbi:MAG: hypothetical protein HGB03_03885 [Candidatus Yonathbacteria bacterium]|nr:hypothetical protein [Candidatus Yonathbacteria bacterium]NTW47628.1 hypothetical protein [Candidatus Yonathbacteria bacterium]